MSNQVSYSASNAVSAAALLGTFGINTANSYDNSAQVIRALNYLNIDTVRESISANGTAAQVQSAMADAGIKFNVVTPNSVAAVNGAAGVQQYVDLIANFATQHSGSVIAVEGQNEVNLFGTNFNGNTSLTSAVEIQKLLYAGVKGNPVLANTSVLNLTVGNDDAVTYSQIGDLSGYSDLANAHIYTGTASNIDERFSASFSAASAASSGNGVVITEMGLTTGIGSLNLSVDETAQAKMILADMMLAYSQGASKAYIYSLFDTTGTNGNDNFGLFHIDGTPKLAATAVHNMTTLLAADEGGAMAGTFDVSGLGTDAHSMNVATASGATDLVLWRSISAWDRSAGTAATVTPNQVTVTFSSVQAHVYIYSPVDSTTPIASYENVSSITVPLSDTPLIVSLGTSEPFTAPEDVAPSAIMTFAEKDFVAQIDALSHMSGLTGVTLTGDHVLTVSSATTMRDILKNYASVLDKVAGGYSFAVDNNGPGWTTDARYDQAGNLISTTTVSIRGDGMTLTNIVATDGTVADITSINGILQKEVRSAADGSRSTISYDTAGRQITRGDLSSVGVTTYQTYDPATGAILSKEVTNPDKSGDAYHYGITGQSYTSDHYVYAAGGVVTSLMRYHADGTLAYSSVNQADGGRVVDNYDAKGNKTQEMTVAADGSATTTSFTYDSAGHLATRTDRGPTGPSTYQTYDAATGAVKSKEVMNADKSGDVYHYGITGQTYVSDHYVYAAGGVVASLTRYYANGTLAYSSVNQADGSRVVDNYDTKGKLTQEMTVAANGSVTTKTLTYDTAGHLATTTVKGATGPSTYQTYDATTGALKSKEVMNADKSGNVYHYGITGQTYASDHYVYAAGGVVTSLMRYYADGTLAYSSVNQADGSRIVDNYDVKGKLTQEMTVAANGSVTTKSLTYDTAGHLATTTVKGATGPSTYQTYDATTGAVKSKEVMSTDKSGDVYHYAITGQSYTSDHYVYAAGGVVTSLMRYYADGTLAYSSINQKDGSRIVDNYDTKGKLTQEMTVAANGSVTTKTLTYDTAGHLATTTVKGATGPSTYQTYDAATGAVKSKEVMNADKSGDVYHYGITGQTYASDHYVYAAGGVITSLTRYYASGTLAYSSVNQAAGGRIVQNYDSKGQKTQQMDVAANGTTTTTSYTYDTAGHLATTTVKGATGPSTYQTYDATTGAVKSKEVMNADKSGDVYHYGITGQTYASDHYVYAAGGVVTSLMRYYASGTLAYSSVNQKDGSRLVDNYDSKGKLTQEMNVAPNGNVTTTTFTYDSAGHLATTTVKGATGPSTYQTYDATTGAVTSKEVMNADKSGDVYHYGITGQSYVSDHYVYAVGGAVTSLTRYYANGTLAYSSVTQTNGSRTVDNYDVSGKLTQESVTAADGSVATSVYSYDGAGRMTARSDTNAAGTVTYTTFGTSGATTSKAVTNADQSGDVYHYGITGQSYTSDHYVYAVGGAVLSLTRYYANGTLAYSSINQADGSRTVDNYDTKGKLTQEMVVAADGSVATSVYSYDSAGRMTAQSDTNAAGTLTYTTFGTSGAITSKAVTNTDKSGDVYHYGITGQSYTSDHYVYAAGGAVLSLTRYYADGTLAYSSVNKADGSRVVDNYDATGIQTQHVVTAADGGRSTILYDNGGHQLTRQDVSASGVTSYWTYDTASGATKTMTVTNPDKSGEMYHYGITGQSYTSDHYVYGAGGVTASVTRFHADGTLDYYAQYNPDGSKIVDSFDAAGHKTLEAATGADGSRAYHGYTYVTDQQAVTTNLYGFTSATGGSLSIVGATVNLVDGSGTVLKALDASDYTLKSGMFTLKAGALSDTLNAGDHAYIDITYAVSNGSTTAPTSMYSIQVDGTLHPVTGTTTLTGSADADRFVITSGTGQSIANFNVSDGDKIDLSKIDANSTNAAGSIDHFTFQSGGAFTGQAGQLIVLQDGAYADGQHWLVEGDSSGDGHADFVLHVNALNGHTLGASDFLLG